MSTALRFVDHPGFHRIFLACAAGAALGGAAGSLAGAGLIGGAAGALAGLSWAEARPSTRPSASRGTYVWRMGMRLLACAAGGALVVTGMPVLAMALALGIGLAIGSVHPERGHRPSRGLLVALAGALAGVVATWGSTTVMGAEQTAGLALPLTGALAGLSVGLAGTLAAATRHVAVVPDPVAAAYRALPPMGGEARDLVERGRSMWQATSQLPFGEDNRELVKDGVLRLFSVAGKLSSAPAVDGAGIERRIAEIDARIEATTDAVAREQYVEARAALVDQRRYVERVHAARERIVARMHHCVATLEKFRMACTQLDATAAAREAADARNAMSVLGELGDGLSLAELPAASP